MNAEHYEALLGFAKEIMKSWSYGDVDGGELHRIAVDHGLLVAYRPVEPCSDECDCALTYTPDDFERGEVDCYRLAEWMR